MPEKNHDDIRTAVFLFILCPVPVILLSVLSGGNSFMEGLGVGMLLGMVAEGVRRCVLAGMRGETMKRLFQKDEYRPEAKRRMNFKDLYWALITGAQLGDQLGDLCAGRNRLSLYRTDVAYLILCGRHCRV